MRNILSILFCLLFLTSCIYKAMYHLSEKDEEWVNAYNENDVYLFHCGTDTDTLYICEKVIKDRKSPFMQSEASSIYNGNGALHFIIKHKGTAITGKLLIVKEDNDVLSLSLRIGKRKYVSSDAKNINLSSVLNEGVEFVDVIFVDSKNSEILPEEGATPKYYIWSYSKGLLQYQLEDEETYTFFKKI